MTRDQDSEPPVEDQPIWKNKWAIGGAVAVALLAGYQMTRRGPEIQTAPVVQPPGFSGQAPPGQPATGAAGAPGQPGVQGQPGQPGQPGPAPTFPVQPVAQPGLPPQPGPTPAGGQPGVVPTDGQGTTYPILGPPSGQLPMVNLDSTPGIGSLIRFGFKSSNGPMAADLMLPDNLAAGFFAVQIQRTGADGRPLFSTGSSEAGYRAYNGQKARTIVPQWTIDDAGAGGLCIALIDPNPQHSLLQLPGSIVCVMDRACDQAYACGRLR